MESFETAVLSQEHGGLMEKSYAPFIESLATDPANVHFSNMSAQGKLGGAVQFYRNRFTASGNYAMQCGIPFKWTSNRAQDSGDITESNFYPGIKCLGDVLKEHGYATHVLYGTFPEDWSIGYIFKYHGFDHTHNSENFIHKRAFTDDYVLFQYQKDLLDKIYKENPDEPFLVYGVTLDTHEPGHICPKCPGNGSLANRVFRCLNRQMEDFFAWMKTKPWYNNTLIVLHGDHLRRDTDIEKMAEKAGYQRRVYNVFVNSDLKRIHNANRVFSHFDIYPTILAAAGVKIKGDRLGLGVNLFSDKRTLLEKYPISHIDENLEEVHNWYQGVLGYLRGSTCFDDSELCISVNITYPQ